VSLVVYTVHVSLAEIVHITDE